MSDAQSLTMALKGHWHGSYGLAYCPAHDNTRTPALSLANGGGDQLLAHCHGGCGFLDIIAALKHRGLIEGQGDYIPADPAEAERRRKRELEGQHKRCEQAGKIWDAGLPIGGTLAETYLRNRGITCPLPDTLRFNPSCWHPTRVSIPSMLGKLEGNIGTAVHRTYLGNAGVKACVAPDKAMLGTCKGGAVQVAQSDGPLVVAEGIETALSLACGLLDGPATIWAALSTSGMRSLSLPAKPHHLIVAPDSDDNGEGMKAAQALAQRASSLGWQTSIAAAPLGQDWNDYIMTKGGSV
ncbi:DUF7146 domain-containing protein [Yoonia sp. MH D7]